MTSVMTLAGWLSGRTGVLGQIEVPGELSSQARVLVAVAGVGAMVFILVLLRRRQLRSKYALLWIALGVTLGTLGLFPGLLTGLSELVGVFYPPALFLLIACGVLFVVAIQFSWELSRLEERTRTLAEELALTRAELADRQTTTEEPGRDHPIVDSSAPEPPGSDSAADDSGDR